MKNGSITRRQAAALLGLMSIVSAHTSAVAQRAGTRQPILRYPGMPSPLIKAKILPGKALRNSGLSISDDWDEFWVETSTPGGFHEKQWSEQVEPEFIEASGRDLRNINRHDRDALRQAEVAWQNDDLESNLQTIVAARGGPVTQAYQRVLSALRDGSPGYVSEVDNWRRTLQDAKSGRFSSNSRPTLFDRRR